ncbi:hypothetical protein [Nocardia sienata]|uniref:hypothetical protein n=1 Tax=Nocardia sienata TaxID=248552 RepID=UPI0007A5064C|nr:hypothetical protein [Nocardia sienata]
MEPPISLSERDLRDRKVDVPRSVRSLADADIPLRIRRGRYCAGTVGQRAVPSCVDEAGVEPQRRIEIFAEIESALGNWRWPGASFVLRSGSWARDLVPLEQYPAVSLGPPGIDRDR